MQRLRRSVLSAFLAATTVVAMALLGVAPASAGNERSEGELRVLFVGNSYTRFNNLPLMVRRLADSVPDGPRLFVERETRPGYNLRRHWRRRAALHRIRAGRYTHVVLQSHSLDPLRHPDELEEYARRFQAEIDRTGARTVLYETWARRAGSRLYRRGDDAASPDEMQSRISVVYGRLARALGADLAPVGRAWKKAIDSVPDATLYRRDGTHPSMRGTYLAACVIYGAVTGRSPTTLRWAPFGMNEVTAARLRSIAAETVREP